MERHYFYNMNYKTYFMAIAIFSMTIMVLFPTGSIAFSAPNGKPYVVMEKAARNQERDRVLSKRLSTKKKVDNFSFLVKRQNQYIESLEKKRERGEKKKQSYNEKYKTAYANYLDKKREVNQSVSGAKQAKNDRKLQAEANLDLAKRLKVACVIVLVGSLLIALLVVWQIGFSNLATAHVIWLLLLVLVSTIVLTVGYSFVKPTRPQPLTSQQIYALQKGIPRSEKQKIKLYKNKVKKAKKKVLLENKKLSLAEKEIKQGKDKLASMKAENAKDKQNIKEYNERLEQLRSLN